MWVDIIGQYKVITDITVYVTDMQETITVIYNNSIDQEKGTWKNI